MDGFDVAFDAAAVALQRQNSLKSSSNKNIQNFVEI